MGRSDKIAIACDTCGVFQSPYYMHGDIPASLILKRCADCNENADKWYPKGCIPADDSERVVVHLVGGETNCENCGWKTRMTTGKGSLISERCRDCVISSMDKGEELSGWFPEGSILAEDAVRVIDNPGTMWHVKQKTSATTFL